MSRYNNIPKVKNDSGTRLYSTVKYPDIPRSNSDIYVITTDGDKYDLLAFKYYNDKSLWWVISIANPEYSQNSLFPPIGIQLRIPGNLNSILTAYNALNR
ncbi:hypothetical protein OAA18_00295 [bacterium]|jgi:phage tail protein X|nr:hypothetical protein [bacterium]